MNEPRIFVEWPNGAFLNSIGTDFHSSLADLVAQYGRPCRVEYREEWRGPDDPVCCERCGREVDLEDEGQRVWHHDLRLWVGRCCV